MTTDVDLYVDVDDYQDLRLPRREINAVDVAVTADMAVVISDHDTEYVVHLTPALCAELAAVALAVFADRQVSEDHRAWARVLCHLDSAEIRDLMGGATAALQERNGRSVALDLIRTGLAVVAAKAGW